MNGLQTIAEREQRLLAPYAMHSADSAGRKHSEDDHPYRGPFQRDRDRIVHSAAFRRLSGKMQVFTGDMGDYHRTRLTHTHEVASIARTIARALRLNEDLVEALALFHDLGHPPFGHCGEEALNECLRDHGGFSHNRFALTLVEELEVRYADFPGLNLTHETLAGQADRADKRSSGLDLSADGEAVATAAGNNAVENHADANAARVDDRASGSSHPLKLVPLLEVQVVDTADSITYDAHDTDDAVKLGLVTLDELSETVLIRESLERVRRSHAGLDSEALRKAVVHDLIDVQVTEVLRCSGDRLKNCSVSCAADARRLGIRIGLGDDWQAKKNSLESLLFDRVYRHPRLEPVRSAARQRLQALFEVYSSQPERLPASFQRRAAHVGTMRAAGEYLAGMTDRFFTQRFDLEATRD